VPQVDDTEVTNFLLSTEIIPLCLRTMEMGSELSKTVATFIVQKILLDTVGLNYICATAERFFAVGAVLGNMVTLLAEQPSVRLLKHIIRSAWGWVLRLGLPLGHSPQHAPPQHRRGSLHPSRFGAAISWETIAGIRVTERG
jgi:Cell differentiation family, Rcd1-like